MAGRPKQKRSLAALLHKTWEVDARDASTNGFRVLARMYVLSMVQRNTPARHHYVEGLIGPPLLEKLPDIAILHVREFAPHPHSSLGAGSKPHPPTEYTSLVHWCTV